MKKSRSLLCLFLTIATFPGQALHAAPIQVSATPVTNGDVSYLAGFTGDSARVVYYGDLTTDAASELYSTSTDTTGTQIKLNTAPMSGSIVDFLFLATGRIAYFGALDTAGVVELYSSSITAAGTQIKISNTPIAGGNVAALSYLPDGSRVVYRGDLTTDAIIELYSASPTAAGTQAKLNSTPVAGGNVSRIFVTPDSTRVIYTGDLTTDTVLEIYSASPTAAGTQITLNDPPVAGGGLRGPTSMAILPDSSRAVYMGDFVTDQIFEIFSASTTATGTQIKLNDTPVAGSGGVGSFTITPDSSRVIYTGDLITSGVYDLYSTSATAAGTQIKLNNLPVAGGNVTQSFIFPTLDSSRVIYGGDLTTDGVVELYSASTTAAGTQIKLSDTPVTGGNVNLPWLSVTPDGAHTLFLGDLTTDEVIDLYSTSTTAAGTQINLSSLSGSEDVTTYNYSTDGQWVVYSVSNGTTTSLWLTAVDGSMAPVMLNTPVAWNVVINSFGFTPDFRHVLYRSDAATDDVFSAFSVDVSAITKGSSPSKPVVTVTISGKKKITTTAAKVTLKGTASVTGGTLSSVQVKVGKSPYKKATGTTSWKFKASLKAGSNKILIQALDASGATSPTVKIKVVRK
jgi:hypothetical protein